ncbi:hypothetical protein AbraIFM66950_002203, partial [Aspergillus brasiliensis]
MSDVQQPAAAVSAHKCKEEGKGWTGFLASEELKYLGAITTSKERTNSPNGTSVFFVDSLEGIRNLIAALSQSPAVPPSIYIDLEGVNLGREGQISILQIYICPRDEVFLVDIHTLGAKAFDHAAHDGTTLRSMLELLSIPKVFFDVRNDSAALFHQYHVELAGVHDLQVMELGTRTHSGKFLTGLGKCISRDVPMTAAEKARFLATKELGKALFSGRCQKKYIDILYKT